MAVMANIYSSKGSLGSPKIGVVCVLTRSRCSRWVMPNEQHTQTDLVFSFPFFLSLSSFSETATFPPATTTTALYGDVLFFLFCNHCHFQFMRFWINQSLGFGNSQIDFSFHILGGLIVSLDIYTLRLYIYIYRFSSLGFFGARCIEGIYIYVCMEV